MSSHEVSAVGTRVGLGLAAIGRPAYINLGRASDLGDAGSRTVEDLRARAHGLLDHAWDCGVRYVDAARSYGHAEEFLGSWLRRHPGRRAELTVGSKWGYEYVGGWRMDADLHERKEHSVAVLERQWPQTLAALGGAPDLYLVHSVTPGSTAIEPGPLLDRLRDLVADGVRVGLSTSGPHQADVVGRALALDDTPFSAVQSTWNLLEQSAGPALAAAHDAGWTVVVKEAMANGRLVQAGDGDTARAQALADRAGLSLPSLALGSVLSQRWADHLLSGAVTPAQLTDNLAARPTDVGADEVAALALPPTTYWEQRSALAWS